LAGQDSIFSNIVDLLGYFARIVRKSMVPEEGRCLVQGYMDEYLDFSKKYNKKSLPMWEFFNYANWPNDITFTGRQEGMYLKVFYVIR
jgi:hypothetical protein